MLQSHGSFSQAGGTGGTSAQRTTVCLFISSPIELGWSEDLVYISLFEHKNYHTQPQFLDWSNRFLPQWYMSPASREVLCLTGGLFCKVKGSVNTRKYCHIHQGSHTSRARPRLQSSLCWEHAAFRVLKLWLTTSCWKFNSIPIQLNPSIPPQVRDVAAKGIRGKLEHSLRTLLWSKHVQDQLSANPKAP